MRLILAIVSALLAGAGIALWLELPRYLRGRRGTTPKQGRDWESNCPSREDRTHCDHWYDGAACCACGAKE